MCKETCTTKGHTPLKKERTDGRIRLNLFVVKTLKTLRKRLER